MRRPRDLIRPDRNLVSFSRIMTLRAAEAAAFHSRQRYAVVQESVCTLGPGIGERRPSGSPTKTSFYSFNVCTCRGH